MEKNNSQSMNDPTNWKSIGFFSAEDYLIYIFKKTEKIIAALYLVSGLLKDDEPMKWELRDKGMNMLNSSFNASSAVPGDKNVIVQSLFSSALETISLLNVARVSNLITEMNHSILVKEIDQVVSLLRDRLNESAESAGLVLSEAFFKAPSMFASGFRTERSSENRVKISDVKSNITEKKNHRQDEIIRILKGQSNLTIKDFSKEIKDCSEKTIQRELSELVEKGIIKKDGERRWSRYSLV